MSYACSAQAIQNTGSNAFIDVSSEPDPRAAEKRVLLSRDEAARHSTRPREREPPHATSGTTRSLNASSCRSSSASGQTKTRSGRVFT